MKKLSGIFGILAIFLYASSLIAQPYLDQEEILIHPRAQYEPVIDGQMDRIWYNAPRYVTPILESYDNHPINPFHDCWGEWRVMWDYENLYFLFEVVDDTLTMGMDWNWDSIELYLDPDNSHGEQYDGIDDVQLRFHYGDQTRSVTPYTRGAGYAGEPGKLPDCSGIIWEELETDHGYIIEAALPAFDFTLLPDNGLTIGTAVMINDDDNENGKYDFVCRSHHLEGGLSKYPDRFGTATFVDWIISDTLRVPKTNTKPIIDGELDPVWNEVSVVPVYSILDVSTIEDYADLSAEFRIMWDANYLYYFITVWDLELNSDGSEDDCVMIYSDGDYSHGQDYDGKNDFQFELNFDNSDKIIGNVLLGGKSSGTAADLSGVLQAAKMFGNDFIVEIDGMPMLEAGFTLEVAFPIKSLLGITPVSGSLFGIEVGYNDDDDGGTIDSKIRTYSNIDEINPSDMAMAKLIEDQAVSVDKGIDPLPVNFTLEQNYPNPFNPSTNIRYTLSSSGHVRLDVYSLKGTKVACLVNRFQHAGEYKCTWNALDSDGRFLPSGMYFCKLQTGSDVETLKMMLLR